MLDSDLWTVLWLTKLKEERLGIIVDPAKVRLQPGIEDGYEWKPLPGKEDLFAKPLSKHSIGAYMELYRGVGVSFEAAVMAPCCLCA
jgi:hypothetical protein